MESHTTNWCETLPGYVQEWVKENPPVNRCQRYVTPDTEERAQTEIHRFRIQPTSTLRRTKKPAPILKS